MLLQEINDKSVRQTTCFLCGASQFLISKQMNENPLQHGGIRALLGCRSKGPAAFNNRRGCCAEGRAARAHKRLSAQPPTTGTATYREALDWKHEDRMEGGEGWMWRGLERF